MMRLSQGQLNLLETCPRRFQHIYLDQLGAPPTPEQQERQNWGTQFHRLMQQRELGLPIDLLSTTVTSEAQLQQCIQNLVQAAPDLFANGAQFQQAQQFRQAEHRRTLKFEGYLLTVIYDLLILEEESALILDWKTYPRPQHLDGLMQNWQTRLYRFVLAETSDYLPEQLAITYWFTQPDAASHPQSLRFGYSSGQRERDRQDLSSLLNQLTTWLQDYDQGQPFPQVEATRHCRYCQFVTRCQRNQEELEAEPTTSFDWADIHEVAI
jgi:hypothetical protein